jgi:hypothetical protein
MTMPFGSLALPSLSPLPARPLPDNLPYRLKRHWVLQRAQVSGFPAFGRGQDGAPEDFTGSRLGERPDDVNCSGSGESAKI